MKLCQGQVWKTEDQFIRITRLERLAVEFKLMSHLATRLGERQRVTKKAFCRLIKNAALLTPAEVTAGKFGDPETISAPEAQVLLPEEKTENKKME